ncbi:hypothetical protein MKX53_19650 [Psychrobacillus sp. FSL K6-4615]|uniref:hypothetical protein n=1 Tax=Psychrobacillus sp. FSL K6-4615 TaxID=2921551 RepID=UPI0030F66036
MKTISFRPQPLDSSLIEQLISTGNYKDTSHIIRTAIMTLAQKELGTDEVTKILLKEHNLGGL